MRYLRMDAIKITLSKIAPISIPYKEKEALITANYSTLEPILKPGISRFPNFIKIGTRGSQALVRANLTANIRVQSLLSDIDVAYSTVGTSTVANMDGKTLSELDIKENIDTYSIS